jgi:CheY-like chemotaxis protein
VSDGPILIVDDDPSIRATISEILRLEGYPVQTAANGVEALEAIVRVHPSLVLLDMRMPRIDGWEFARRLTEHGARPPIIVMTAARDARRAAADIGADAYLTKPFEIDQLLTQVAQHMEALGN